MRTIRLLTPFALALSLAGCADDAAAPTAAPAGTSSAATTPTQAEASAPPAAASAAADPAAPAAQADAPAGPRTAALAAARERLQARRHWWTDEEVAATLSLSAQQQAALLAQSERHEALQVEGIRQQRAAQQAFRRALRDGDLAAARAAAQRRADVVADNTLRQQLHLLDQLSQLDAGQRQALLEQQPERLSRLLQGGSERRQGREREPRRRRGED